MLPRYISVDGEGREREFLAEALGAQRALELVFLKGYQWPFDTQKVEGSSLVDLLVHRETSLGRRVFLDFRQNPQGLEQGFAALSHEAREYLERSGAGQPTPIQRLAHMNPNAIELYAAHSIDLWKEPLEIALCAQHNNGGLAVDAHWQSTLPGLYVAGEAAGTFGVTRPGGSALNSTQVGSLRAARHIRYHGRPLPEALPPYVPVEGPAGDAHADMVELQRAMTRCAAFQRDAGAMRALAERDAAVLSHARPLAEGDPDAAARLRLRDMALTQREVLGAMVYDMEHPGAGVLETRGGVSLRRPARPIPQRELWFERAWRADREEWKDQP